MRLPEEQPHFVRRYTAAGIESICTGCLATIAKVKHEADLFQVERDHMCDPRTPDRFAPTREAERER